MVERSLAAADRLVSEGIDVEVVDLRSVVPLDHETVVGSVAKTSRLVVVDEDYLSFGLSGELVSRVVEELGPTAVRGVRRVAEPDVPIPAALSLEREVIPNEERIADAVRDLAR
jgi:pyruvate dehydrogenase E1 component beta subunit